MKRRENKIRLLLFTKKEVNDLLLGYQYYIDINTYFSISASDSATHGNYTVSILKNKLSKIEKIREIKVFPNNLFVIYDNRKNIHYFEIQEIKKRWTLYEYFL